MAGETLLNGRYALVAQQGSGGMSVIYKAIDRALGRTVAVKILRPSLTQDPSFLDKFRMEARSVANLSHPNIVTVHDVGSEGQTHYIVMEMVEGTDLKKIIKAEGALPIKRVLSLASDICDGIGYAHRSGLVHADVKPQNILVTPEDMVKVTDFGIAQALSDTQPLQRQEVVWGSPHYFSPEQARGEQPTTASDVYAIGIVLFEMLTGQLPYSGANQQELALAHIKNRIPNVSEINPHVPDTLARIVYQAMSKEPRARYRDADQLGGVLKKVQDRGRDVTAVNPQVPQQPAPRQQPPRDRPPGFGIPPAPVNNDATSKYSAAPNAPRPYDPRRPYQGQLNQQASVPAPTGRPTSTPQPLEQRYTPQRPAPQQGTMQAPSQNRYVPQSQPPQYQAAQPQQAQTPPVTGDSSYFSSQRSQPIPVQDPEGNADGVTIGLAIVAFLAVAGLFPLWIFVLLNRGV